MSKTKTVQFPKKIKSSKVSNIFGEFKKATIKNLSEEFYKSRSEEFSNELKKIKTEEFPLRSSLFWYYLAGTGWQGCGYQTTWALLSRNWQAPIRDKLMNKQLEYNSNMMTFYIYHYDDPNCVVNPCINCPTPSQIATGHAVWDEVEIAKWMPYIELGKIPGIWIIPSLFCGDSYGATNNTAFHDIFIPPVVIGLHPYIKAINIGSEMSKTMNVPQMARMIAVIKNAWASAGLEQRFVLVHLQCDRDGNLPIPPNADGILLETSNHPKDGNNISVTDMCTQVQKAISKCPIPIAVTETNMYCEDAKAREQSGALKQLPGVWCLPGPV